MSKSSSLILNQNLAWTVPGGFSKDPLFFPKYHRNLLVIFLILDGLLIYRGGQPFSAFNLYDPLIVMFSLYLGPLSAFSMHNAAHGNFKPRWLNQVVGELTGVHQLYGFAGWRVGHMIHHQYPDYPGLDPHFPGDKKFWEFAVGMLWNHFICNRNWFYRTWGLSREAEVIWRKVNLYFVTSVIAMVGFWYLLLGTRYFLIGYLPSHISMYLFFIHFNFVTHRPDQNGHFQILNLNRSLRYKMFNFLFFGVYFHKNHHQHPRVFNPSRIPET